MLVKAMIFRRFAALAAVALTAGCSEPPGQYKLPAQHVYQTLKAADFKEFMRNRQCGVLIHITSEGVAGKSVTWRITSSGQDMLTFTARLIPVDATHTQVAVEVSKELSNGREAYDGTQFYRRPAVKQPVRPAIEEQIAAVLSGRPFDYLNLTQAPASAGTFSNVSRDSVCDVQRGRLEETGEAFSVDDPEDH